MSVSRTSKRPRAPNFSPDEKIRLLNIIKNYKDVVENKKTDAVTWHDKNNAWTKITAEFNATALVQRSKESLKGFFENQKRCTHKKAALQRKGMTRTGGGSFSYESDPIFNLTLDIVNKKTVYGLTNPFDGDSNCETITSVLKSHNEALEVDNFVEGNEEIHQQDEVNSLDFSFYSNNSCIHYHFCLYL